MAAPCGPIDRMNKTQGTEAKSIYRYEVSDNGLARIRLRYSVAAAVANGDLNDANAVDCGHFLRIAVENLQ